MMHLITLINGQFALYLAMLIMGKKVRYDFRGKKVHILACKEQGSRTQIIRIDGCIFAHASFRAISGDKIEEIIFSYNDLPYGEHAIEIENVEGSTVIGGIYYDPLPQENTAILGFDDLRDKKGEWSQSSDGLVFSSNSEQATASFYFYG